MPSCGSASETGSKEEEGKRLTHLLEAVERGANGVVKLEEVTKSAGVVGDVHRCDGSGGQPP